MIRVGLFVIAFPRASETFIVTKVLKLLAAGFDVRIYTLTAEADWDHFSVLDGRDDVRACVRSAPPMALASVATRGALDVARTIASRPAAALRMARHAWQHRADAPRSALKSFYEHTRFIGEELDILHVEFDYQGVGIADLKHYLGARLLLSGRGTLQSASTFTAERAAYLFRHVDGYHFISRFLADNAHRLGLPADIPTWHIEPAIDLSLFEPAPRVSHTGPLRIVSVGRLSWAKGYEFALDAIAHLRARGIACEYTIYGWGPYEEAVTFAIRQLQLGDCVRLGGTLAREDVPAAYATADVMLHASVDEGFCNAVIEAQAMQLPVVCSDAGGLPENVEDGVTGFVVPRRDARALADKLALLAGDPALRERMGRAGRERALARFDLNAQAEAFVRLYRELAAMPRRAV